MEIFSLSIGFVGLLLISFAVERVLNKLKNGGRPPLPPGPKGLPVVGNVNDLPKAGELDYVHWLKHKELYGQFWSWNLTA